MHHVACNPVLFGFQETTVDNQMYNRFGRNRMIFHFLQKMHQCYRQPIHIPVSSTHLDVYKRQILPLLLLYVSIFSLLSKMTAMNFESK